MALIVEDGTGLANADSYVSLVNARLFATDYGISLPVDDTEAEIALRQGAQYVDLSEPRFTGERLSDDQALAWPRVDSYKCNGIDIPSDEVPSEAWKAQVYAAQTYGLGTDVRSNYDGKEISSEKVASIKVDYFETGTDGTIVITKSSDAMRLLLCKSSNPYTQRTLRV